MFRCQLASEVAHLLPVLTRSCLCSVAPKQGPDSGPKNGATILKLVAPASKFVAPILGPWYMRFAFCKECVELRQVASSIHVFLRMVPGYGLHSITDMCCCQLASEVAHLLPVLTSSCLCFMAPKQGPDSGSKNGATILKLVAQLHKFWAHGICVLPSAKGALSCGRLHLPFMFSCVWCQDSGFTCRVRSEGRQNACKPTAPKMGPLRSASQRNVSKGAGMPVLLCSKHGCHKQCKDMCTTSAVYRTLGATPGTPRHQS